MKRITIFIFLFFSISFVFGQMNPEKWKEDINFLREKKKKNPSAVIIDKLIAVEWDLCERIMIANKPPLTDDEKRQIDEAWNVAEEFTDE